MIPIGRHGSTLDLAGGQWVFTPPPGSDWPPQTAPGELTEDAALAWATNEENRRIYTRLRPPRRLALGFGWSVTRRHRLRSRWRYYTPYERRPLAGAWRRATRWLPWQLERRAK